MVQAEAGSQGAPLASGLCSPVASSRRRATPTIAAVGRWCSSWSASRSASTANTWFAPAFRSPSLHLDRAPAARTPRTVGERRRGGGGSRRRAPPRGTGASLRDEERRPPVGPRWRKWRRSSRFRRQTAGTIVVLEATTRRESLSLTSARDRPITRVVADVVVVNFHRSRRIEGRLVRVVVVVVGYRAAVVTVEPSAVGWWWNTAPRHTHPI